MVKVRIKFSADLIIEANNIKEARSKWDSLPLWSEDAEECGVEFSETLLVEDADTYHEISAKEWDAM